MATTTAPPGPSTVRRAPMDPLRKTSLTVGVEGPASNTPKPRGGKMRTIVQDAYGSSDVLRLGEIDRPEIAANEVLVELDVAGMVVAVGP